MLKINELLLDSKTIKLFISLTLGLYWGKKNTHIYSMSLGVSYFDIPSKTQSPFPMELITSPSTVKCTQIEQF